MRGSDRGGSAFRRRPAATLARGALFLTLLRALACGSPTAPAELPPAAGRDTVRIMTYNIFHDGERAAHGILPWAQRRGAVVELIRAESPDVLGLQEAEVWQVSWLLDQLPEYDAVARGEGALATLVDAETVAILYRRSRFTLRESGHFWYSDSPDVPGSYGTEEFGSTVAPSMATWVRLARRDARAAAFYVYNTHFIADEGAGDAELARARSAELLTRRIADRAGADEYFFVIGDLNAGPNAWPVTYLLGARCPPGTECPPQTPTFRMIDVWASLHPEESTRGSRCNAVTGDDGERVDYLLMWDPPFAPPDVGISDADIVGDGADCPSDHLPVAATVVLPLSPTTP